MAGNAFPDGFLWGAATSAHQVEGDNSNNDWWRFEQSGGGTEPSGAACDHYNRFEADFDLAVELGHTAHRLSIEWSRIEPKPGVFDEVEIAHYVAVLEALRARGLTSFVTLHHFTNPLWFADAGGWENPGSAAAFGRYARLAAERFSPLVDFWVTINEPTSVIGNGYLWGLWPPAKRNALRAAGRVSDNMADAHVAAAAQIHAVAPDAQVGFSNLLIDFSLGNEKSAMWGRVRRWPGHFMNHRFCDRVAGHLDFIGVQYYHTIRADRFPWAPGNVPGAPLTDLGWNIVPAGLHSVVMDCWNRYGIPIYVTENGLADKDDAHRAAFITDHLRELERAIDDGADVRGYLHWSLMDNYEWSFGYAPRFGLVAVDYATQTRTPRPSAYHYRDIIRANGALPLR